jgi:hypothetical protein
MGKKRIYMIVAISIFLLATFYFLYYIFLLDDEKEEILTALNATNSSVEMYIADVNSEKGFIQYCHFNNCDKYLYLPFENIEENDFNRLNNYKVEFNFAPYLLYSWGDKERMKSWSIKEAQKNYKDLRSHEYLVTLKQLLSERYLWEIYSIPVSEEIGSLEDVLVISEVVNLDWEYTKSLYLLHKIAEEMEDKNFQEAFNKEIAYLNKNIDEVIEYNNQINWFPPANLLELADLGLNEEYLSFVDDYIVKETFGEVLELQNEDKRNFLIGEEYYSNDYRKIRYYSDYYPIFSKYGYDDLAKYSYDQMINVYNMSNYKSYGLCSIAYSTGNIIPFDELLGILQPVLDNNQTELIEGNLYELILCNMFARKNNRSIEGLDNAIDSLRNLMTFNLGSNYLLVTELSGEDPNTGEVLTISTYNILDVLMYLVYEQDIVL